MDIGRLLHAQDNAGRLSARWACHQVRQTGCSGPKLSDNECVGCKAERAGSGRNRETCWVPIMAPDSGVHLKELFHGPGPHRLLALETRQKQRLTHISRRTAADERDACTDVCVTTKVQGSCGCGRALLHLASHQPNGKPCRGRCFSTPLARPSHPTLYKVPEGHFLPFFCVSFELYLSGFRLAQLSKRSSRQRAIGRQIMCSSNAA